MYQENGVAKTLIDKPKTILRDLNKNKGCSLSVEGQEVEDENY